MSLEETKRCSKCSLERGCDVLHNINEFAKDDSKRSGYKSSCRKHDNLKRKAVVNHYRETNRQAKEAKKDPGAKTSNGIDPSWAYTICTILLKSGDWKNVTLES